MWPENTIEQAPRAGTGAAEIEMVGQWDFAGELIKGEPAELEADSLRPRACTWVYARMPEFDPEGNRVGRTDWTAAAAELTRLGLPTPDPRQQSALGTPHAGRSGSLTALGASVLTVRENRIGVRRATRLARFSLVPVGDRMIVAARHRDGLDWFEPCSREELAVMRPEALLKRDQYRATSLLASIEDRGRVTASTSAESLALETILATTQAYPRAILSRLSGMLGEVERHLALFEPNGERDPGPHDRTLPHLLQLIAAIGRLERELSDLTDALERRDRRRAEDDDAARDTEANLRRTLELLTRMRGDARTTVDMIGSTRASAQLQVARREVREAAAQREQQQKQTQQRQQAEQALTRNLALLTSVLLIPTLVASVFGANVTLPREETVWKTWLMLACMVGLGSLSYATLRELDPSREAPSGKARTVAFGLATVGLGAAAVIALGAFGTG